PVVQDHREQGARDDVRRHHRQDERRRHLIFLQPVYEVTPWPASAARGVRRRNGGAHPQAARCPLRLSRPSAGVVAKCSCIARSTTNSTKALSTITHGKSGPTNWRSCK